MKNPLTRITKKNSWKILAVMILSLIIVEFLYIAAIFSSGMVIITGNGWGMPLPESIFDVGAEYRYYVIFNEHSYRVPKWQVDLLGKKSSEGEEHISKNVFVSKYIKTSLEKESGYIYKDKDAGKFSISSKPDEEMSVTDIENIIKIHVREKNKDEDNKLYIIEKYKDKVLIASEDNVYHIKGDKIYKVHHVRENYYYTGCILK